MANYQRYIWFTVLVAAAVSGLVSAGPVGAQEPREVRAFDRANDKGDGIVIEWEELTETEQAGTRDFKIYRSESPEGPFLPVGYVEPGNHRFVDTGKPVRDPDAPEGSEGEETGLEMRRNYYYEVARRMNGQEYRSGIIGPVQARPQVIHLGKLPIMIGTILFFLLVALFIQLARHGRVTYVRPIAGMSEIDNAIGRATEMGRPILYVLGLGAPDEIATIASYTILARVARRTAEYRTDLIVPCNEPIVMTIAQETVKNAYIEAGHPDAYNEDMVFFVTSMQFAYVAAVNGIMLREKTATNCYFGKFYAESLLLSETGNIAGSIQVAGTDEVAQLPFFVTTCDYTLIGEELYAASAYLGRDPLLLGALKAQDLAKAIVMLLIVIGALLMSFDIQWLKDIVTVNV
ncbi:MAG TPA: hypothetical protein PLV45_01980 [bacterium]|nr:hypothetical protein [bacterium]